MCIARPLVHGVDSRGIGSRSVRQSHHHLLSEDVPSCSRGGEALKEPLALVQSKQGITWIEGRPVHRAFAIIIGLIGAVLAGIEDKKISKSAKVCIAVERHFGAYGER